MKHALIEIRDFDDKLSLIEKLTDAKQDCRKLILKAQTTSYESYSLWRTVNEIDSLIETLEAGLKAHCSEWPV